MGASPACPAGLISRPPLPFPPCGEKGYSLGWLVLQGLLLPPWLLGSLLAFTLAAPYPLLVTSDFHLNEDIVLPSLYPWPFHPNEVALHSMDVV